MNSKPPSSTAAPAGVPSGGNGKYIVLVLLLLGGVGGLIYWKKTQTDDVGTVPSASVSATLPPPPRRNEDYIPPPPDPVASADAAPPPKQTATYVATNGCDAKVCSGRTNADLEAALGARARASRRCYNNALASDNTLTGKLSVSLRIGSNGTVCSANIGTNELNSSQVSSCVLNTFRSSSFPSPTGGCAEASVPMNFVQQH